MTPTTTTQREADPMREAFEAHWSENGPPQRMHRSYPPEYVEQAEKDAAWAAWTASRQAALEEAAQVAIGLNGWGPTPYRELAEHIAATIRMRKGE